MSRTNYILLGLAVIQVIIVLLTSGDGGGAAPDKDTPTGGKPYGTLDAANVGNIEIGDGENTIAAERIPGKDGKEDTWGLSSKEGFPVRSSEVTTVVNAVNKLVRGRVVTRKKKNLTGLGVSEERFNRHVVLKDKTGGTIADFYLGEGKQSDQVFFRKSGEESAWHATGASTWEFPTSSSTWVDTSFTDITFDDVVKVKLERESGAIEFERQERPKPGAAAPKEGETKEGEAPKEEQAPKQPGEEKKEGEAAPKEGEKKEEQVAKEGETEPEGAAQEEKKEGETGAATEKKEEPPKIETETHWALTFPEQKDLDKSKVESLVRGLCKLYLGDPVGKTEKEEYGFAKPTATATITLKDGAVRTITLGKKRDKENDYYAKRTGFEYIATIRNYSTDDYFLKKLDDLLPKKEEEKKDGDKPKDEHEGHDHK